MMTCEEFTSRVSDLLDGRIPFGDRVGMWMHMALCVHCRRYARQMRGIVETMKDVEVDAEPPSEEMTEALVERFRAQTASSAGHDED